jgi:hypothetical protein
MSRNPIWDYFTKLDSDLSKAKCNECGKLLSLGSDKPAKQTVAGLKSHCKSHKEQYATYEQKVDARCKVPETPPPSKKAKLDSDQTRSAVQMTLQTLADRSNKCPDDHPIAQRIDKSIMDLIIVDMLPYSLVEGDAFKRLNFADPCGSRRYCLKSEKYFRTSLMPATYDKVVERVRSLLSEANWITFTTDGWSNPPKTCSLLSFTGHFLHQSQRRKVVLGAMVLEQDHTGQYLAAKLTDAISKWNLDGKIHMGIRDNAANMVSAMRIANVDDFGCVAHTLQLVLRDAIFTRY